MVSRGKFVTEDEFEHILSIVRRETPAAFPPYVELLLRTFWATGCRPSELTGRKGREGRPARDGKPRITRVTPHHGLRGQDILPEQRLHVAGKNTSPDNDGELKERQVLCADRETWEDLQERAEQLNDPSDNVFLPDSSNGIRAARRYKEKLQDRLSGRLKRFSWAWLRHSHAIHALRNGVDLVSIQRQLGHAHLRTTANYLKYAGLDEGPYFEAFDEQGQDRLKHQCPSCGFDWTEDAETGEPTWEARMGKALRRRR